MNKTNLKKKSLTVGTSMTGHTIDMCSNQRLLSARCKDINLKNSVLNKDQGTIVSSIKQKVG